MAFKALPRRASVARNIYAASGAAAEHRIRVHLDLPHSGEHHLRIVWIDLQAGAAGVRIREQHAVPMLATVFRAIYAAFLLRSGCAPQRAYEYDVGIRRMDDHLA